MNYKKLVKYKKYFNILNENAIMNKLNKKYLITKPSDIINNDDGRSHIIAFIQNLILIYIPTDLLDDSENYPRIIAQDASIMHGNVSSPQSAIWCPLIYNALKYSGHNIPVD